MNPVFDKVYAPPRFSVVLPELERGKEIHADGRNANGPFCIAAEVEGGEYEQEDASEHPGRIPKDRE